MKRRKFTIAALSAAMMGGCASSKFKSYNGPEVTSIVVKKGARRMHLLHGDTVLKSYDVDLGRVPDGPKQFHGDGKTPEGLYRIDRRNPKSSFHLSVGISYPNTADRAFAESQGKRPGGDIFIHGQPNRRSSNGRDWTEGCIAVTNREMEEIYAMVQTGTVIALRP